MKSDQYKYLNEGAFFPKKTDEGKLKQMREGMSLREINFQRTISSMPKLTPNAHKPVFRILYVYVQLCLTSCYIGHSKTTHVATKVMVTLRG